MKYKVCLSLPSEQYLVFRELGNDLFLLLNGFNTEEEANIYIDKLKDLDEFELQLSTEILSRRVNSIDAVVRYKEVCKHCGKIKNDS